MGNVMKRWKSLSPMFKASFVFAVCSVWQKLVQFAFTPVLTRLLSVSEYGEYSIFWSYYEVLSIFATLNLSYYVLNNGLIYYEHDKDDFTASLQSLSILVTLGLFLIYIPFRGAWQSITGLEFPLMLLMFAEFIFKSSFDLWCIRLKFDYKYKAIAIVTFVWWMLVPSFSVILIFAFNDRGYAAITGRVVASCVAFLIPALALWRKAKHHFNVQYWRYALKFNIPLIPHFLAGVMLVRADQIMIERLLGSESVAVYALGYSIASVPLIINQAVLSSFIPYTYQNLKAKEYKKIRSSATYLTLLIAVITMLFVLFAPEFVMLLGTEEYQGAVNLIPPIAICAISQFMFNLYVNIEYFYHENKYVPVSSVLSAVVNIALNWWFIPRYGYAAAAYTTLVTYLMYAAGNCYFMKRVCKKHCIDKEIYNNRAIWLIQILAIALSLIMTQLYKVYWLRYICILVMLIGILLKRKRIFEIIRTMKIRDEKE